MRIGRREVCLQRFFSTRSTRAGTHRAASDRVSNPMIGRRAVSCTRSARGWPGFPRHGLLVLDGMSTETLDLDVAVPDTAAAGDGALVLSVAFTGAGAPPGPWHGAPLETSAGAVSFAARGITARMAGSFPRAPPRSSSS